MLIIIAEFDEVIRFILLRHGCRIEEKRVTFPEGTTSKELLPRMSFTQRDILLLPDGTMIYKLVSRIPEAPVTSLCVTKEVYENALHLLVRSDVEPPHMPPQLE